MRAVRVTIRVALWSRNLAMSAENRNPAERPDTGGCTTVIDKTRPISRRGVEAEGLPYIQLEVVGGPMDGESRRVETASFAIGRGEMNDLTLRQDPTISVRHARILREGQHYWLEDLKSSNGTFIGDLQIREKSLIGAGSVFVLGRTTLEFMPS